MILPYSGHVPIHTSFADKSLARDDWRRQAREEINSLLDLIFRLEASRSRRAGKQKTYPEDRSFFRGKRATFGRSRLPAIIQVARVGLEPTTNGL